jgi:hypothetical protein
MAGTKIPDKMVVRAANRRWFTNEEEQNFKLKSMLDRSPAYGICGVCADSGPAGMHCQFCKEKQVYYKCPWAGR